MATAAFGPVLETAIKQDRQGGTLTVLKDRIVTPRFYCCVSGTSVGVAKDPIALLVVDPTRVCAGDNVNVDFSHSWSPSSTIATWTIDWGDGNSSSGAWPGPGNMNHPDGGYSIPATYTITLTVTDLLGATGEDTRQVEVIDCAAGPPLGLFAGCGSSGVWYSENAGIGWAERGGGVLEGVEIYDLKVHPFSLGSGPFELWAATENGLYKSVNSGESWRLITLPDPDGGTNYPLGVSVVCSTAAADEVYVLGYITTRVWLFGTTDGGDTWDWIQLSSVAAPNLELTVANVYPAFSSGRKFVEYNSDLVCAGIYRRNDATETWAQIGAGNLDWHAAVTVDSLNNLWEVGDRNDAAAEAYFGAPGAWTAVNVRGSGCPCIWPLDGGQVAMGYDAVSWGVAWHTGAVQDRYDGLNLDESCVNPGWNLQPTYVYRSTSGTLFVGVHDPLNYGAILRLWGECPPWPLPWKYGWVEEHNTTPIDYTIPCIFEHSGVLYATRGTLAAGQTQLLVRAGGGTWSTHAPVCSHGIFCGKSHGGRLWVAGDNYVSVLVGTVYVLVYTIPAGRQIIDMFNHGGAWFVFCSNGEVYRLGGVGGDVSIPAAGRTHLTTMAADGQFIYAALLDDGGNPIILRVTYGLEGVTTLHEPGTGTWGGVKADYNDAARVWAFGDFGADKILLSDDWGDTLTAVGAWAGGEVIRPILPSIYDSDDVMAILNTALQSWRSGDGGTTWAQTGDIVFSCHCGERDWIEDMNIFTGRVDAGADHLQYSPNNGVGWAERSGGITANAEITAVQVVF